MSPNGTHAIPRYREYPKCQRCGLLETELSTKLKRCTGCKIATYCSKECQKEAWSTHRLICRVTDSSTNTGFELKPNLLAGYPAAIALEYAVTEWHGVHNFAISTITTATAELHGGVDHGIASSHVIFFSLIARPAGNDRSTANAFHLREAIMVPMENLSFMADSWRENRSAYKSAEEDIRSKFPDDNSFAGMLPAAFVVQKTTYMMSCHIPVHRRVENPRAMRPHERVVLQDIRQMCIGTVNSGHIFRVAASGSGKADPDVGTVVQRKKNCEWRIEEDWDWHAVLGSRPGQSGTTKSGLHPREVWAAYYMLPW
ncbi:hypothetical protein BV20DRAFT_963126 [Pilatotrama ljubarskyi]|nr:hypothetical protein BV20DRAFT_963126 [Pilatotrama ljubarskyi]